MADCCSKPNIDGECLCYHAYCRSCGKVDVEAAHLAPMADLRKKIEIYEKALAHYADESNWESAEENTVMDWYSPPIGVSMHGYDIAAKALEEGKL
jgi:hypothetical protein